MKTATHNDFKNKGGLIWDPRCSHSQRLQERDRNVYLVDVCSGTQRPICWKMYYGTPGNENICYSGIFRCFSILLGKNYLFLFPSKTHMKFPSQEDKIGWFPSQLQSEQPASRRTRTIFYIVRQNGRGKRPPIDPSVGGRGGGEGINNAISEATNFPASSSQHLLFCQQARFSKLLERHICTQLTLWRNIHFFSKVMHKLC